MPPLNGARDSCTFGKRPFGSNLKSTSVRFSRDIFQSPRYRAIRLFAESALFCTAPLRPSPALPFVARRGRTSIFAFIPRTATRADRRRNGSPHNSKRVTLVQSCPLPFTPQRRQRLFPSLSPSLPHGAIRRERILCVLRMKNVYLSSAVIHLTSFALSIQYFWNNPGISPCSFRTLSTHSDSS